MSDRRRRWICQFFFVAVCVLPTAWVLLRVSSRPGPEWYAQQLQMQLGVPVIVGGVTTPTPEITWLQRVRVQHPETGVWAEADRITMFHGPAEAARPRWQIEQLTVREAALTDFLTQLHHTIVRQRLHAAAIRTSSQVDVFPMVHVRSLVVVPGELAPTDFPHAVARPVVKLKDLVFDWRTGSEGESPRLEMAAKLVPPRQEADVLAVSSPQIEVPVMGTLERQVVADPSSAQTEYVTRWEVAILERAVPVAWLNLASWPELIHLRPELEFSGLIGGVLVGSRWQVNCREARLNGLNLSDIEFMTTGQRSDLQATLHLNIREMAWSGLQGGPPEWVACDVELNAANGALGTRWIESARRALGLTGQPGAVIQASYDQENTPTTVSFEQLNLGVRWHHGTWWFRPLPSEMGDRPLPVLRGYNQQEQVVWPGREERPWRDDRTTHEAARVNYLGTPDADVPDADLPDADLPDANVSVDRKALDIAEINFAWQPSEFVQGVPNAESFGREFGWITLPELEVDRQQIRQWIENPSSMID